jgi:hypothetical protein
MFYLLFNVLLFNFEKYSVFKSLGFYLILIPSSLPDSKKPVLIKTGFFLAFNSGGKLLQSLFRKEITFILNLLYISAPSIQISFAGVSFTPLYTFIKNPSLKRSSEYAGLTQIQGHCHD